MSRKHTRNFTGSFIPKELKTNEARGRAVSIDWTNTSDREESLSDPRWHKRPPTKDRQMKKNKSSPKHTPTTKVIDARNLITGTKLQNSRRHQNRNKRRQLTNNCATDNSGNNSYTNNAEKRDGNREILHINSNK